MIFQIFRLLAVLRAVVFRQILWRASARIGEHGTSRCRRTFSPAATKSYPHRCRLHDCVSIRLFAFCRFPGADIVRVIPAAFLGSWSRDRVLILKSDYFDWCYCLRSLPTGTRGSSGRTWSLRLSAWCCSSRRCRCLHALLRTWFNSDWRSTSGSWSVTIKRQFVNTSLQEVWTFSQRTSRLPGC